MTGSDIFAYFRKQTKEIEKNFFRALVLHEEIPIHDLRVAVKRIRALFKFLREQQIMRPDSACYLYQLNKIYHALGNMRDIQIRIGLLKSFNLTHHEYFVEYQKDLKKHLKRSRKKLSVIRMAFSFAYFLKFSRHKPFYPVTGVTLDQKRIITERITKIRRHLRHRNKEQHLHQIRKRLKEIYYCMEMCGDEALIIQGTDLKLKKIRKLEDSIGQWHDTYLFAHTIQPDYPAFVHISGAESFREIQLMICNENQKRMNHILRQLEKYQLAGNATPEMINHQDSLGLPESVRPESPLPGL